MLVLDANILIRAVLGKRVRTLLSTYGGAVEFLAPDIAFADAREHLPKILKKRGVAVPEAVTVLEMLHQVIQVVELQTYSSFEDTARRRLRARDVEDWPVLATALTFGCPIWTEDADFFGAGVATWTTDRVELFLQGSGSA